jgi:hypothetical protein
MRRLEKQESRQRYRELRGLWNEWDPIGVAGDENDDEYESYVGPCLRLLEKKADTDEIVKYLNYIIGEYMGLGDKGIKYSKPVEFAQRMQAWYATKWPDTMV